MEEHNALNEIKKIEAGIKKEDKEYDPTKNPNAISIIKQPDGNYKGWTQRNGKLIEIRTNDPQTVLLGLLTASGE